MYYALFKVGFSDKEQVLSQTVKNLPAMQETPGSIHGSGRSPGKGNGYSLQYSCLENFMNRGAWWSTVHGVSKSQTQLKDYRFHFLQHDYRTTGDLRVGIMTFSVQCCNINSQPNIEQEIWMIACLNNRYIIVYPTELWIYTTGPCDLFVTFVID